MTGTWFIDPRERFAKFLFGPQYPKFYKEGREALIEIAKARAAARRTAMQSGNAIRRACR
ncbi:MAG: hypothetical protein ABIT16_05195 [Croceibacterium sp.]